MNYYVKEVYEDESLQKTAGIKARDDAERILESCGFDCINIESRNEKRKNAKLFGKLLWHFKILKIWKKYTESLKKGDSLFIQIPVVEHSVVLHKVFRKLKKHGINVIFLIHDLESLRFSRRKELGLKVRLRLKFEDKILSSANYIIVHNNKMKKIVANKIKIDNTIVSLKIFDYLITNYDVEKMKQKNKDIHKPIIIAGNLRRHKAGYAYNLPEENQYNLYGIEYTNQPSENINYFGAFEPDELPYVMDGSFGIVWDGETSKTCSGVYGEYLKINNPHKTSLYLACGIPVIIWKEAALADFIEKYKCGITVSSLEDVNSVIRDMTEEEYDALKVNTQKISLRLREGKYLKEALKKCNVQL